VFEEGGAIKSMQKEQDRLCKSVRDRRFLPVGSNYGLYLRTGNGVFNGRENVSHPPGSAADRDSLSKTIPLLGLRMVRSWK
jgi:hypothetical protein